MKPSSKDGLASNWGTPVVQVTMVDAVAAVVVVDDAVLLNVNARLPAGKRVARTAIAQ